MRREGSIPRSMGIFLLLVPRAAVAEFGAAEGEVAPLGCTEGTYNMLACPDLEPAPAHTLCVLVPYKNRENELRKFAPFIDAYLNRQKIAHEIWILEQSDDDKKFNRGWLINVGFVLSQKKCDYLVMHDVDMLPNATLPYIYPTQTSTKEKDDCFQEDPDEYRNNCGFPVSMFNGNHPIKWYNSAQFIGAVFLLTSQQFINADGFSTDFWVRKIV
jgi:xylosylprotein 4-beta-galactosyltransferase